MNALIQQHSYLRIWFVLEGVAYLSNVRSYKKMIVIVPAWLSLFMISWRMQ